MSCIASDMVYQERRKMNKKKRRGRGAGGGSSGVIGILIVHASALQAQKGPVFLDAALLAKEAALNQFLVTGSDRH